MQVLAIVAAGLFAGAAVYVNVVEHPARMTLGAAAAAAQWAPSYERGARLQAPLAALAFVAGSLAWLAGGGASWLAGALLIGAAIPYTLIVVMPTNQRPKTGGAAAETGELLARWNRLHAVRTAASLAAFLVFVAAR